jgi:hypothetical protein
VQAGALFSNSAALLTYAAMPFEGDRFIVSVFGRCEIQPSFGRLEIQQSPWHNGCLEYCAVFFALRSKDSFAPSELRVFLLLIPRVPPSLHPGLSSCTPSAFSTFSCSRRFRSAFAFYALLSNDLGCGLRRCTTLVPILVFLRGFSLGRTNQRA